MKNEAIAKIKNLCYKTYLNRHYFSDTMPIWLVIASLKPA